MEGFNELENTQVVQEDSFYCFILLYIVLLSHLYKFSFNSQNQLVLIQTDDLKDRNLIDQLSRYIETPCVDSKRCDINVDTADWDHLILIPVRLLLTIIILPLLLMFSRC